MRPIKLRFACFGPYVQEQTVDFQDLEKSGLFLICGETGAGKTTILDAICYALYGRSSGGLRGDISVMRCKNAQKDQETFTEFTFETGGKRYRFERSLKYGRKNLNDSHNCLVQEGEAFVPIFENPKATVVNKEAERLIGLTYDQFRQVIVLPQGQFERLLVSDSAEKEKILVSLFHADRWQRMADRLMDQVQQQDAQLRQERLQIQGKLREYGCESLEELRAAGEAQGKTVDELTENTRSAEEAFRDASREKERAVLENRDFEELANRKTQLQKLQSRAEAMNREETLLKNADTAETIAPQYQGYLQAEKAAKDAAQQEQTALQELKKAQQKLEQLEDTRKKLDEHREKMQRMKEEIVLLTNAAPIYEQLPQKQQRVQAAEQALKKSTAAEAEALARFRAAQEQWLLAQQVQQKAYETYSQIQSRYLRNIGSTLARALVEGSPCPVCGSCSHPNPAPMTAEVVSAEQVEQENERLKAASQQVTNTARQREQLEKQHREAQEVRNGCVQEQTAARQELEAAQAQRFPQVENLEQLHKQISLRGSQVEKYEKTESGWQQAWNQANANGMAWEHQLAEKRGNLQEAENALALAREEWETVLRSSGLETETAYKKAALQPQERQRRWTALLQYQTDLRRGEDAYQTMAKELEGRQAPDLEACRKKVAACETAFRKSTDQLALSRKRLADMERDLEQLTRRQEAYAIARQETDADMEFANRLRGRSGLSLQRYVLGVMLTAITVEANRRLSGIYGGRYQLFRTDAISGSGHKGGLELEVFDSQNSQRRSVTTLSGGEKFLVALSLAIGLSTVVQAQGQGIRLEAMFIDEGFGSLDREAVLDAMGVLQDLRRPTGTIGIISHVETLAEIIPTRLEVRKGPNGSNLVVK